MKPSCDLPFRARCLTGLAWTFLGIILMPLPARSATALPLSEPSLARSVRAPAADDCQDHEPTAAARSALLLADGWTWSSIYSTIETFLGSQRRMFQVGAIGMCIALYVIWMRR